MTLPPCPAFVMRDHHVQSSHNVITHHHVQSSHSVITHHHGKLSIIATDYDESQRITANHTQ
jgi:hypothetical protein